MSPSLESQVLRTRADKDAKELCKAVYELKVRNYLVIARKS